MRIRASDTVLSVGVLEFRERCCCHEAFNRGWRDPFKWPLSLGANGDRTLGSLTRSFTLVSTLADNPAWQTLRR